jgi:hypothetical protein
MCDARIDNARLLDYLDVLERWVGYAWNVCGEVTP